MKSFKEYVKEEVDGSELEKLQSDIVKKLKQIFPKNFVGARIITLGGSGTSFITIANVPQQTNDLGLSNAKHKIVFSIIINGKGFEVTSITERFVLPDPTGKFAFIKDKSVKKFRKVKGDSDKISKALFKWVTANKKQFEIIAN